jgi:hypothetical protein
MYSGVPKTMPAFVIGLVCDASELRSPMGTFAMPKSSTFTKSASPALSMSITFSGFRSR